MKIAEEKLIYFRLIALWVLCEAMLGGIIHGLRIPASGFIVGSCAVICIAMIAYYVPSKGAILKATLIVAIFKMMLSPQAPPPAYFAVFFQGLLGEILFWNRNLFRVSCLLFGILALLESGLQRIVILTIVYGNDLWHAVNDFINGVTGQTIITNYSLLLITAYVLTHAMMGIIMGFWAGILPQKISTWGSLYSGYLFTNYKNTDIIHQPISKKRKLRKSIFIIWLALILLYIQSSFHIGSPLLSSSLALQIFIRSLLIILTYYFFIGPFLTTFLTIYLQKRKVQEDTVIQKISQLLPSTQYLVQKSWQLAAMEKGLNRLLLCSKIILLNTFSAAHD